jgi:ATP-binding cassette subfamily B protein
MNPEHQIENLKEVIDGNTAACFQGDESSSSKVMERKVSTLDGLKRIKNYAGGHITKTYKAVILILFSVIAGIGAYIFCYGIIEALVSGNGLNVQNIGVLSIMIAICGVIKGIMFNKGLDYSHEAAYHILINIREQFAAKMVRMPLGDINEMGTGNFKRKIVEDVESIEIILAHVIPEGLPYLIAPFIVYPIILITDWRLGLLSLVSLPFGIIAMGVMFHEGMKKMPKAYEGTNKMNKTIIDYVSGIEVIKIFGRTTDSYEKYASSINNYKKYALDWWRASWLWMAMYTVLLPCTIMFMLPVGIHFYLTNTLDLGTFIFALLMSLSLGPPLLKLLRFPAAFPNLAQRLIAMEEIYENREIEEGDEEIKGDDFTIVFDHVCFTYDKEQVIKDVSCIIHPGQTTAIVGESGSGKSTLVKLLIHHWDVDSGSIKVGGLDIRKITVEKLMDHVSYVDQDTFLFNMTLKENIRLGKLEATNQEIIEAAKAAQCHDFIMEFPDGYDTKVGDAGSKLSGGEGQRITLARAILRDAPVIVLDEATAYADPENQDKIHSALGILTKGKTVVVIAHHLSTIKNAKQIIVLDEGEVAAIDTHDNLLADCKQYLTL